MSNHGHLFVYGLTLVDGLELDDVRWCRDPILHTPEDVFATLLGVFVGINLTEET
jgi:hypothetical protein